MSTDQKKYPVQNPEILFFVTNTRVLQFLIQKQISKIHFLQIPNNILDLLLLPFDEQNDLTLLIDKISLFTPHHSKRMKKDKREKNDFQTWVLLYSILKVMHGYTKKARGASIITTQYYLQLSSTPILDGGHYSNKDNIQCLFFKPTAVT